MKISEIIRTLMILWFTETLIALFLYLFGILLKHNIGFIGFILLLKAMHFIYYYWILFILYLLREEDFSVKFFCITNTTVFLVISFFLSVFLIKDFVLFFNYSFVCNLSGIVLAPYLLKKINLKLPEHLRIY
jgi:hypothetical protein